MSKRAAVEGEDNYKHGWHRTKPKQSVSKFNVYCNKLKVFVLYCVFHISIQLT